ncbi:hypothetical protein Lser_V15G11898 [Lactuca serriola]
MPHTTGRYQARRFRKAQYPIVERLTNSLTMHGRNNDKKVVVVRILKHAMEIIHHLTDANPIQIIIDAVINRLWIWSSQFKGEDNPCDWSECRKENSTCLVALGIDDGEVFTINATSAELKCISSGHHHSRTAGLSFANKGRKLCAISTDGKTCEMNSETDDKILPASNTKIRVLTLDDGEELLKFSTDVGPHSGLEGSDAGLASVLESMEFCLKLQGSEACVLEDLAKAINLVHIRRDLVESGHALLNHTYHNLQEYERYEGGTRICDSDGIGICDSIPMPNKRSLILSQGGTRISDSNGIGICDYVGIRIYDSIPLPNQRNLIIYEGGTRINDYDRIGISDYG